MLGQHQGKQKILSSTRRTAARLAVLAAVAVSGLQAQSYSVSFQPQGAESLRSLTGKKIKAVGVLSVSVCSREPLTISAKRIEQIAAEHGMSIIDPAVAPYVVARARSQNKKQIALDIAGALSGLSGALTSSRVIAVKPEVTAGLVLFSFLARPFGVLLRDRLPDPAWQRLLLTGSLQIPANGCASGLSMWLWHEMGPRVVRVNDADSGLSAVRAGFGAFVSAD